MAPVEYCIDYLKRSEYLDQVYSPELLTLKSFKVSEALIQSSSDFIKAKNELKWRQRKSRDTCSCWCFTSFWWFVFFASFECSHILIKKKQGFNEESTELLLNVLHSLFPFMTLCYLTLLLAQSRILPDIWLWLWLWSLTSSSCFIDCWTEKWTHSNMTDQYFKGICILILMLLALLSEL